MQRYFLRLVLITLIFHCIFPLIPGFHYHGSVLHSIPVGVIFTTIGSGFEVFFISLSQTFRMRIQKIYLLIPAWFLGFGLFPAILLKCFTQSASPDISFSGWEPAIVGGVLIFCIGIVTGCGDFNIDIRNRLRKLKLGSLVV